MKINCEYCGKECEKWTAEVNRAQKAGYGLFCDKVCAGLKRRTNKPKEQLVAEKAEYDRLYRKKNKDSIKKKKAAYNQKDYAANPEKYKQRRRARQPKHNEYCRNPKYKAKKKVYDRKHRAIKHYGEWGESLDLILQIADIVDNRQAQYDKGCHLKKQNREKLWKNLQQPT